MRGSRGLLFTRAPLRSTGHHPTTHELERRRCELPFMQDPQLPENPEFRGIRLSDRVGVLLAYEGAQDGQAHVATFYEAPRLRGAPQDPWREPQEPAPVLG